MTSRHANPLPQPVEGRTPGAAPALTHTQSPGTAIPEVRTAQKSGAEPTPAQAFDALYAFCAPALVRQAYLLTGRHDGARAAAEAAFRQAWQRWPEVAHDRDPAGWVRAATYECALSPWHRLRRRDRLPDPPPDAADRALQDALLRLPPSYRRTLVLYDGVGLGLPETAAETEASTPATASRLMHAREAVAAHLPELADPTELHRRLVRLASAASLAAEAPAPTKSTSGRAAPARWTGATAAGGAGATGAAGVTGVAGVAGVAGAAGLTGVAGVPGVAGLAGAPGVAGAAGVARAAGVAQAAREPAGASAGAAGAGAVAAGSTPGPAAATAEGRGTGAAGKPDAGTAARPGAGVAARPGAGVAAVASVAASVAGPAAVRTAGERSTRFWTRSAFAFTVTIIGATTLTLRTAPTHYLAPVSPGHAVQGLPTEAAAGPLSQDAVKLRAQLKAEVAGTPERLAPETR